jgi:outer membrane protein assembly factor BamB
VYKILLFLLLLPVLLVSCSKSSPSAASQIDTTAIPAVTDNRLVFAINLDGNLYAFDATSGAIKWKNSYKMAISGRGNGAAPAMTDSTLYVVTGDMSFYGLDAYSGNEKWHFQSHSTTGYFVSPLVKNNILFTGDDQTLYAIEAKTGLSVWETPFNLSQFSPPVVDNGILYAAKGSSGIYSLDATTGAFKTSFGLPAFYNSYYTFATPVVKSGIFYGMARNDIGAPNLNSLRVLDVNSGVTAPNRQGYDFPDGLWPGVYVADPVLSDSVVYTAVDSVVYSINTYYTGKETAPNYNLVWKFNTGNVLNSSPIIDSTSLYIISSNGYLLALDRKTGSKLWTFPFFTPYPNPRYFSKPVVANGVIYFGSFNGFYAVWARTGKLLWQAAPTDVFNASPCVFSKSGQIFQIRSGG